MKCQQIDEYINLYLDELISEEQTKELNQHIKECEKCREAFLVIKNAKSAIESQKERELPEKFHEDLMQKISILETKDKNIIKFPFYKIAAVAAAFALTVFACYNFTADDFGKGIDISGLETKKLSAEKSTESEKVIPKKNTEDKKENKTVKTEITNEKVENNVKNEINTKTVAKNISPDTAKESPVAETSPQIMVIPPYMEEKIIPSQGMQTKEPEAEVQEVPVESQPAVINEEIPSDVPDETATEETLEIAEPVAATSADTAIAAHTESDIPEPASVMQEDLSEEPSDHVAFARIMTIEEEPLPHEILSGLDYGEGIDENAFKFELSRYDEVMEALSDVSSENYSVETDDESQTFTVTCF